MPNTTPTLDTIFCEAVEIADPAARDAYLDGACGSNDALRREVSSLVAAHFRASDRFLDHVPPTSDSTVAFGPAPVEPGTPAAGTSVGPYKLLEPIGEGGMGLVFVAEQTAPVRRKVALKVIKPGMDSRQVVARFEQERQALALMDHPHIAKVFDAGTTAGGLPYFAMELVRGLPLTRFCDSTRLPLDDRLRLFAQVCRAVQHAHQKGVIHRDLKPSNVLVGEVDGKPVPKVIDFGIAKAVSGPLTDATLHTGFHQFVGTPQYMSPEQADLSGVDVDTRSDVYSLGVLLYELLTGGTPLDPTAVRTRGLDEVRRMVREDEPAAPSKRLSTLDAEHAATVADARQVAPARLARQVRGELDWVVMAALEKDRKRRYQSPADLAADVERYLADEPVQAAPPSAAYRLRKFVRKNRVPVAAAVVILFALLLGIVGTTFGLLWVDAARRDALAAAKREGEERTKAEEARAETLMKEAEANAAIQFFEQHVFTAARPKGQNGGLGSEVKLKDAIESSLPKLSQAFATQPLVEARLRTTIGITFNHLGLPGKAAEQLEQARDLYTRHYGTDHPDTLRNMTALAASYAALNRQGEALNLREEVAAGRKRVLPKDHPDTLGSMNNLAVSYQTLNRHSDAVKLLEEVLAIQKQVLPKDHPHTLTSMTNLANSYTVLNQHAKAIELLEEVVAGRKRVLPKDDPDTLACLMSLANTHHTLGHYPEAVELRKEVVEAQKRVLPKDHPDTLASMADLANSYQALGRKSEALKLREEVLAVQKRVLPKDHPDTLRSMNNLANSYAVLNRPAEAFKLREEVLAGRRRVLPKDHPETLRSMTTLANSYSDQNRQPEAIELYEEAIAAQRRVLSEGHPDTLASMTNLASSYADLNRNEDAVKLFEEVVAVRRRVLPKDHPRILESVMNLANLYTTLNRHSEALPLVDEVLDISNRPGVNPRVIPNAIAVSIQCHQKAGNLAKCREMVERYEKLNQTNAVNLYEMAGFRAATAALQAKAPGADAARLAKEDADRAMVWLTKAVAAGWKDVAHIKRDTDLDPLRERDDFKRLIADLEAKFPSRREVLPAPRRE